MIRSNPLVWRSIFLLVTASLFASCQPGIKRLRLATTTTTIDSGLLQDILPQFESAYVVSLDVIAVGTGEALALGRAGDVDVVLVHAREAEDAFIEQGYGLERRDVMYNDFVLIGPAADPAGIAGGSDALEALAQIHASESLFVSRGDQSGTHLRETRLWQEADIMPRGDWYLKVGQGMGAALTIASERQAYTLSDRGTYIARNSTGIDLEILVEGDRRLFNPYGAISVNPAVNPQVEAVLAEQFLDWISGSDTQQAINQYRIDGKQLFFSNASSQE
jgi:tungstate transport system substrate-binding protein